MLSFVVLGFRFVIAFVFLKAGLTKLRDPTRFGQAVRNYPLVREAAARLITRLIPFLEVAVGLLLALGVATEGAALAASGLLLGFTAAVLTALTRGLAIDCGCFGGAPMPVSGWTVARNAALLTMAASVSLYSTSALSVQSLWLSPASAIPSPNSAIASLALAIIGILGWLLSAEAFRLSRALRLGRPAGRTIDRD